MRSNQDTLKVLSIAAADRRAQTPPPRPHGTLPWVEEDYDFRQLGKPDCAGDRTFCRLRRRRLESHPAVPDARSCTGTTRAAADVLEHPGQRVLDPVLTLPLRSDAR